MTVRDVHGSCHGRCAWPSEQDTLAKKVEEADGRSSCCPLSASACSVKFRLGRGTGGSPQCAVPLAHIDQR